MPLARSLCRAVCVVVTVVLGAGILADDVAADSGDRRFKDDEIVREGLVVASFRGLPFRSGSLVLQANGSGYGQIAYGDKRLAQAGVQINWQEQARDGSKQRPMEPGRLNPRDWWHPTHRVVVRTSDTDGRDGFDADDLLLLSKQIADKLAARALPWEPLYQTLRLQPEVDGYRLVHSDRQRINSSDGSDKVELKYQVPLPDGLSNAERRSRHREFELRIKWFAIGKAPENKRVWKPSNQHVDDASFDYLISKTHYVSISVRGAHVTGEGKHKRGFRDRAHRQEARRIAAQMMERFEHRIAEARDAVSGSGGGLAVDRPRENERTDNPSGRVTNVSGGVRVMRAGRRVNLRAGGQVQLGDTILTSGTGTIEIRFDDPSAGPSSNGRLTVGPRSKVTIDIGPYRPKSRARPTRIQVDEGSVRFDRPHHHQNPRFELGIPGDTAIFGLHGTDAVLYRAADRYVLALADGMGDLALNGKHHRVLTPIHAYEVGFDGRDLGEIEVTRAWYDGVVRSLTPKPGPEDDLESLLGEDIVKPEEQGGEWIVGRWVSHRSAPRLTLQADDGGAFQYLVDDHEGATHGTWSKSGEGVYRLELHRVGERRLDPVLIATARLVGYELEVTLPDGKVERFDLDAGGAEDLPPFDEAFATRPPFVGLWNAVVPDLPLRLDVADDGTLTYWDNRRPDVLITGGWKRTEGGHAFTLGARNGKLFDPPMRLTVTVNEGQLLVTFPDGKPARFERAR